MADSGGQYTVTIHGNVYGFGMGNEASVTQNQDPTRNSIQGSPFMTPALPPQGIFGRDDVMTKIFDGLELGDNAVRDVPPLALRGLGGIGKTTLAKALGRLELIPRLFPDGVLWAELGPTPTIRILLDGWGKALGVDLLPERDENTCRERLRAVLSHRRVLLIVDDVWQTTHGQFFLVAGPQCRSVLTTRDLTIAQDLATRERTLRVDVLPPEAAFALLRKLAPEAAVADETAAKRLCEKLEFLPLALTLAGRLLANEADVPSRMQRILGELIEQRAARLHLIQTEGKIGLSEEKPGLSEEKPVSLEAILGMSVQRLEQIDQERFAMLSVFGGEPLTWEINAAASVWDCPVPETEKTISHFIQRGLVERRDDRYWMHALLADYAAEMMDRMDL
jgi:hypothetical protein